MLESESMPIQKQRAAIAFNMAPRPEKILVRVILYNL